MIEFEKKHPYLVCMDSDGTVMDTMTIKHERCFGPCFIEVFGITNHKNEIIKKWDNINLYSKTRGINRFHGLDLILQYVAQYGYTYEGYEEFHNWFMTTNQFSVNSIKKQMETATNLNCFELALEWSRRVNEEIEKLPMSSYFDGVFDAIQTASKSCDLVGVSSANPQAVQFEWNTLGIAKYFSMIACQDKGTKSNIILDSLKNGYEKENTIMLGDAVGDLEAAKNNGVWFFPIIPKHEVECWRIFIKECLPRLINGTFDINYQQALIDDFYRILESGD